MNGINIMMGYAKKFDNYHEKKLKEFRQSIKTVDDQRLNIDRT